MPKIVYLDTLPAQNGIDILENQSSIEVVKINSNGNYKKSFLELETAHAYQVSAARDEVPKMFQVNEEFLSKTPNLLLVSSGGAGFDTIDVEACTKKGILVVNQTGGNAEAVAEHWAEVTDTADAKRPFQGGDVALKHLETIGKSEK